MFVNSINPVAKAPNFGRVKITAPSAAKAESFYNSTEGKVREGYRAFMQDSDAEHVYVEKTGINQPTSNMTVKRDEVAIARNLLGDLVYEGYSVNMM